jgi:hypothetical protein
LKRFALAAAAAIAAVSTLLTGTGMARAENSVIPASASSATPWSGLEQHATRYASQIAGRAARVHCHGHAEWASLGLPEDSLGAVRYLYDPYTMVIAATEDIIHLHESVCTGLQRFGEAAQKPTSCATYDTISGTVSTAAVCTRGCGTGRRSG